MLLYVSRTIGNTNGVAKSALDVYEVLKAIDPEVKVVSPVIVGASDDFLKNAHEVKPPVKNPFPSPGLGFPLAWYRYRQKKAYNKSTFGSMHPDLIVVNSLASHELREDMQINAPAVMIVRESPRHFTDGNQSLSWAEKALASYPFLIFVSGNCRDEWRQNKRIGEIPSWYIPNCCEEHKVAEVQKHSKRELRQKLGMTPEEFALVCVGSFSRRKGQDLLIRYLPQMVEIKPSLKLYFVGNDRNEFGDFIRTQLQEQNLEGSVVFTGQSDEALSYIAAADVMMVPSRAEALPRVVLEAMALKTPVIASDVDGIPELIRHEITGLLFPMDQTEALVTCFGRLVSDAKHSQEMAEQARQTYWREFSCEKLRSRYKQAILDILST